MANHFRFDASELFDGLGALESRTDMALRMYAETAAKDLEGYMKQNAPWTNRTGHARQRLTGTVEDVPKGYRIKLAHGVDYGLHLEYANEKKYAILEPALLSQSNKVVKGFGKLLSRLGG